MIDTTDPTYEAYVAYAVYQFARDVMWPRWNSAAQRYEGLAPDIQRALTDYRLNPSDENRNHVTALRKRQEAAWRDAMKAKSKAERAWYLAGLGSWSAARANHDRWCEQIARHNAAVRRKTRINGEIAAEAARYQGKPEPEVQRLAKAAWDAAYNATRKKETII